MTAITVLEKPGIRVKARVEQGSVRFEMEGKLASLLRPLKKLFKHLEEEKPAAVLEDRIVFSLYLPPFPSRAFTRVLRARLKSEVLGRRVPEAVTMAVTRKCPCNCVHCSADRRKPTELSTEDWQRAIQDALDLGTYNVTFTGGDPLFREDLPELIRAVDGNRAVATAFTSGYTLEDRVEELKEAGLYAIHVSIDSPDPEEHDELRGVPGLFERCISGIKAALDVGLLVGVSTYATQETVETGKVEDVVRLAADLGAHEVTIFDAVPTGRLLHEESVMLSDEHREDLINLHLKWNREKRSGPRVSTMSYVNSEHGAGCFAGYVQCHVTNDGEVTPCDFTPISFGNIREDGLKAAWKRITSHPEWGRWRPHCRMQDPEVRRRYIRKIPPDATLPVRIDELEGDGS
ncbi:radical SAM protein [Methanopyrus sp. SNP6]|uniref:radical SAM protein n=1 Tax=Methanopyrus sp. SNP6 TaxID=1937005 RepID=UPI0011E5A19F|nr:radical SAM protein [Methanopyrus sp. SNP6]